MKLLVPAPYVVPEKKAKKKKATGTRKSSRHMVVSDSSSDESETHSSREDEEEEEETSPPPAGGGKKRKAALVGEAEGSKKRKTPPPDYAPNADESKCSDTRVTHDIPFVAQLSLMSNIIMQSAQGRARRVVERLPGLIEREFSSARCLPLCRG